MRKKRKNKNNSKIYELCHILDPKYFHVSIEYEADNSITWYVYYKNLPMNLYFSNKNKALLSSKKNNIKDIYVLNDKFEKEKQLLKNKEYLNFSYKVFSKMSNIKDSFYLMITDILLVNVFSVFLNVLFFRNIKFSILNLINTILIVILGSIRLSELNKKTKKLAKDIEEDYIKTVIKKQGLSFLERLRIEKQWN